MTMKKILIFSWLSATLTANATPIYKYVDDNGRVTYSSKKIVNAKDMKGISGEMKSSKHDHKPVYAAYRLQSSETAVNELADWCISNVPSSETRVRKAKRQWIKRHQSLLVKAEGILSKKMSPIEKELVDAFENDLYEHVSDSIEKAPKHQQKKMCHGYADRIRSAQFNFISNRVLVNTLKRASK